MALDKAQCSLLYLTVHQRRCLYGTTGSDAELDIFEGESARWRYSTLAFIQYLSQMPGAMT